MFPTRHIPHPPLAPLGFLASQVMRGNNLALIFDVDKTAADTLQATGGHTTVRPGILDALKHLERNGVNSAFMSGRTEERLLAATRGSFPIGSRHGRFLILSHGQRVTIGGDVDISDEIDMAQEFLKHKQGLTFFTDGSSMEIGYQGAEQYKTDVESFMEGMVNKRRHILQLLKLKMVCEIIGRNVGKGFALDYIMDNDPAFVAKMPIYFGDDNNDIPAGKAAQARGGFFVWVGDCDGATNAGADCFVPRPASVEALLNNLQEHFDSLTR